MKDQAKLIFRQSFTLLKEGLPVLIFVGMLFFGTAIIGFQQDNRDLLRDTKAIAERTEEIVSKQDETLEAIEQLALDNKISGDELKDILLCMLVVPIEERTTDTQEKCRKEARQNSDDTIQQQPTSESSKPKKASPKKADKPEPKEQPSFIESIISNVTNLIGG